MSTLGRAITADDTLVEIHGRRFGIVGDGQAGDESALQLDGKCVLSNRQAAPFFTATAAGNNGAGAITVTGAVKGDTVVSVNNLSSPADASSSFESTVTVTGQVQQSSASNLSGSTFLFIIYPRS
jgi:hypothetical protein